MSNEPNSPDSHAAHEGPIKTPKQLIAAVIAAFVVPIVGIVLFVNYVTTAHQPAAGTQALDELATAQRIQPVGSVALQVGGEAPAGNRTGEEVFKGQCSNCHASGLLGAPKFGDAAAWGPRIAQGFDALWQHALKGKNNMPPQGGANYSDTEVGRAVVYMANAGGAKFAEPAAPAGAASAPAAADAASAAAPTAATAAPVAAAAAVVAQAAAPAAAGAAPALFQQVCTNCHTPGAAGAPKLGDKAAWAPRIVQGIDGLTASAIKGKNAMPPRGGSTASDAEIKAVVTYMVNAAK